LVIGSRPRRSACARGPRAARMATPPARLGHGNLAARPGHPARRRPRPHAGAGRHGGPLDADPRDRLRDLVQLHALSAGPERTPALDL